MNVEMFFVKSEDRDALVALIAERLTSPADPLGEQPDWGMESSYDALLARERKRKVAVSPVESSWIAAVESKEVLDFAMLEGISQRLGCEVIACQLANITDSCGYARCYSGRLLEKKWVENAPDPLGTLRAYLREHSVPYDFLTFREAVQLRNAGWEILPQRRDGTACHKPPGNEPL